MLAPTNIYYSQDSISNRFGKCTQHSGVLIGKTLDDILSGKISINDISRIEIVSRDGVYRTADNRRLWVFKKLESLGECSKVPVRFIQYINPQKCVTESTIRVRGDPGGILWRTWTRATCRTKSVSSESGQTSRKVPIHLKNAYASPSNHVWQTKASTVHTAKSATSTFRHASNTGCTRNAISARLSSRCLSLHMLDNDSENSNDRTKTLPKNISSTSSAFKMIQSLFQSKSVSTKSDENLENLHGSSDNISSFSLTSKTAPAIMLPPSKVYYSQTHIKCHLSNLEKDIKNICDGTFPVAELKLEVYSYQRKMCAIDNEMLWKLRVAEKFQRCPYIQVQVVSIPICTSYPYYSDEIHIETETCLMLFSFCKTISKLPTLEAMRVDPSKILYSSSSIYDEYHGESILKALVDFRKHPEALNVVKYERKFYALENRKLWLCKQVSKIEKRLKKITVHVKMNMDYNMFRYFTANGYETVKIKKTQSYTDVEETFLDFLEG